MEEKQKVFIDFMNEFVKLNDNQKSIEILEKEEFLLSFLLQYASANGIDYSLLKSNEVNKVNADDEVILSNYLDAIMVYAQNIEDLIGLILERMQ